jgi:hypothetical protein
MALWGATALGLFFGYRPPKRHTRFDHLSFVQKLGRLDLPGFGLLTVGLTLFLTGLNLGGGLFSWTAVQTLATLIIGIVILLAFAIYEWKFTKTGIMSHELFRGGKNAGRTFALCVGLIFIEGILLFSYIIFYPVLTTSLFETDPFLEVARGQPFWVACGLSTVLYGYASTKLRTIRAPLFVGFFLFTAGLIGLTTIQPGDSTRAVVFAGLAGLGFGGPLVLIIAGVQLSTPHHLIATATALTVSHSQLSSKHLLIHLDIRPRRLRLNVHRHLRRHGLHPPNKIHPLVRRHGRRGRRPPPLLPPRLHRRPRLQHPRRTPENPRCHPRDHRRRRHRAKTSPR